MSGHCRFPNPALSIVRGPDLAEEPGLGALTLPGFIREVTQRFAERERHIAERLVATKRALQKQMTAAAR